MSKVWRIARYHFVEEARKRSFLIVLFSLPLFLLLTIGMAFLAVHLEEESTVLGYVDEAGFLVQTELESKEEVQLVPFATSEAALAALEAGQINAYYVLAPDYAESRQAELVYIEPPDYKALRHFDDVVRLNLMADQPSTVTGRVLSGAEVTVLALDSGREFPAHGPNAGRFAPIAAGAIFGFLVLTMSGYMMEAIVAEKENRTMEIVLSSASPGQLMAGKIAGGLAIALLQLVVWLVFLIAVVWVGGRFLGVEWLQGIELPGRDLFLTVVVAVPGFLFLAALMTTVGSTLVDSQEAQAAGGFFFIPMFLPVYLALPLIQNPDGTLALVLSFLPLTSVTTMGLRCIFVEIPAWQYLGSAALSLVCGLLMVWLAGKAFRMTMLRYGQRLNLRELFVRQEVSGSVAGRS